MSESVCPKTCRHIDRHMMNTDYETLNVMSGTMTAHDANNVSTFGGDPVTQLHLKNV